jgi:hypothetical protein
VLAICLETNPHYRSASRRLSISPWLNSLNAIVDSLVDLLAAGFVAIEPIRDHPQCKRFQVCKSKVSKRKDRDAG